ncbi:hypothetical protein [Dactylosporangium sp. NPDC051541]|uniref:hypothetical protein n=1 Tax=Dactylosporangium sp. NPDC051541 TaxID=3363977 RepID=UPI003790AA8D
MKLLVATALLTLVGTLPPAAAAAQPTPEPTAPPPSASSHQNWMGDVLHGEGIVKTKTGPVRVAIQNGEATKVTDTALTVRSTDDFTRTWKLPQDLKVHGQQGALRAGAEVSVFGTASGESSWTAKHVVVRSGESAPGSSGP